MGRNYIEKVVMFLFHLAVFFACVKESQSHIAPLLSSRQQRGASETDIVSRIARIPLIRTPSNDDLDFSSLKLGSLKSPGYNFHYRPHKLILPASSITSFSSENSQGTTESSKRSDLDSSNGFSEEAYMLDEESPTFTPYIGAHALSNMEKFFEHLRENLEAMQNDGTAEIDQPERRRTTSGEAVSYEGSHVTHEINSSPGGGVPPAMALQVQPQPSVTYRERSSYYIPSGSRLQKIQTFIQPLTEQQKYLQRANNYNPSWLWTNLGLGKRRRR